MTTGHVFTYIIYSCTQMGDVREQELFWGFVGFFLFFFVFLLCYLKICLFSFQMIFSGAFQKDRFMVLGMLSEHRGSGPCAVYF